MQDPSPDQDTQNSSKRKRISEVVLADMHPADKNKCIQQSPNFREIGEKNMEHMLEYSNGSNIGNKGIEGGKTLMNMTDVCLQCHLFVAHSDFQQTFGRYKTATVS